MKSIVAKWILLVPIALPCWAQNRCPTTGLEQAALRVLALQSDLRQIHVGEMDDEVPPSAADKLSQLKDALRHVSDLALACEPQTVEALAIEKQLAQSLHANAPEPPPNTSISKDDHRYDEILGAYGHNLRVKVSRPSEIPGIIAFQYSTNIECGEDSILLLYEFGKGHWNQKLRWESPPLKTISDAFGDFLLVGFLHGPSADEQYKAWQVVVAHGTPWCTSRFSGFQIDLLSPGKDAGAPTVLWHAQRAYSRGDFDPRLKATSNTFELRLNADCMDLDPANCFERRVIYRYKVEDNNQVQRINPVASHALGFVEEWLSAPWDESQGLSDSGSAASLLEVHERLDPPSKPNSDTYVSHGVGPVRACRTRGIFQVQIDSSLERIVPGKPGGESKPLPSVYFHVRELKDGYLMLSAPTEPDAACTGPNLMPAAE